MFVRLTKSVSDYGELVRPEDVDKKLKGKRDTDWYQSPFYYGEDALEYFENNVVKDKAGREHNSIKGYTGEVWTDSLYWDLDYEDDIGVALDAVTLLLNTLEDLELIDGAEVYFSGNKGFHVFLKTENKFTQEETKRICYSIAVEAGVLKMNQEYGQKIYDPTVYNVNRIFRIPNTKHQKSDLYKVQINDLDLLDELTYETLEDVASEPRILCPVEPVDAEFLKQKYKKPPKLEVLADVIDIEDIKKKYKNNFNPMDCPPDKRRCIYVLENGYFGSGERENASIRLVAYYHGQGWAKEQTAKKLEEALLAREELYDNLNPWNPGDVHRVVDLVYSDGWNGGTYSCKDDEFLRSKCDLGNGPCCEEKRRNLSVVTVGGLIDQYKRYGAEALENYPETGLEWIDSMVRFRPRNYSIVNGANGSGKTSLVIQWMEHLNRQKMYHIMFSADMANTSMFEKLGARHTEYSQAEIEAAFNKHTEDLELQQEIADTIKELYPYTLFDFTSALTSKHVESTVFKLADQGIKVQVVFIDYAGRMIGDNDSQYQNATQIALEGNDIAKNTSTHLCFISQVPREEGDHTRPLRSSRVSKDSGAWEENATIVLNVWRPFGNGVTRKGENEDNYMHIYIAKNRSGALGERVFWWDGKTGTVRDILINEWNFYKRLCEDENKEPPIEQFGKSKSQVERASSSKLVDVDEEEEGDFEDNSRQDNKRETPRRSSSYYGGRGSRD